MLAIALAKNKRLSVGFQRHRTRAPLARLALGRACGRTRQLGNNVGMHRREDTR
jgi:hypothetical protein